MVKRSQLCIHLNVNSGTDSLCLNKFFVYVILLSRIWHEDDSASPSHALSAEMAINHRIYRT